MPGTKIYVGDVMTLIGLTEDVKRVVPKVGQAVHLRDRTDTVFLAGGLAVGFLVGLLSLTGRLCSSDARWRRRGAGRGLDLRVVAFAPSDWALSRRLRSKP